MPTNQDDKFAEAAVAQGLVSPQSMKKCLDEIRLADRAGLPVALDALLVKRALLTRVQANDLLANLNRKRPLGRIGGFQLIEELGRGGMGTVYKARQVSMDRLVALKVLPPQLARNKGYIDRFFTEARAVAKLSHINIIQGYDVGEASGYYYFAMEFIDGESVATKLARQGTIDELEALTIIEQICRALDHALTTADIIHRDIKPDNIMLTKVGVAKLADLGLAKMTSDKTAVIAGTPHYVSPEQGTGSPNVDTRSDIYALGATLYHMLTGALPFNGATAQEIINKHLTEEPPSPRSINPALSMNVCRLISTMMAKAPEDRYQSPGDLLEDVRLVKQGVPPQRSMKIAGGAAGSRPRQRQSTWPVMVIIASALIFVVALCILIFSKSDGKTAPPDAGRQQVAGDPGYQEFADAQAYAEANPWKLAQVIDRYEAVAKRYPGTTSGEAARQQAQAVKAKRDKGAESKFVEIKKDADAELAQEHYSRAIAAYANYPAGLKSVAWKARVDAEIKKIQDKANERVSQIQDKAKGLADKQQYDDAIAALRPGLEFGFANVTKLLNDKTTEYRKLAAEYAKEQEKKQVAEARERYVKLVADVVNLERQHAYSAALTECDRYLKDFPAGQGKEARDLRDEVQIANDVWIDALAGLHKQLNNGIEIRVKGILFKGKLRKVGDRTFTVETNVTNITKNLDDIDPESWLLLAGVLGEDKFSVMRQAAFYLAMGATEKAKQAIAGLNDPALLKQWTDKVKAREKLVSAAKKPADG